MWGLDSSRAGRGVVGVLLTMLKSGGQALSSRGVRTWSFLGGKGECGRTVHIHGARPTAHSSEHTRDSSFFSPSASPSLWHKFHCRIWRGGRSPFRLFSTPAKLRGEVKPRRKGKQRPTGRIQGFSLLAGISSVKHGRQCGDRSTASFRSCWLKGSLWR